MDKVTVNIENDGESRATEIIADLRAVAETLFFPMKLVGFWDYHKDMHLCPQEERRLVCPHELANDDPKFVEYAMTLQRERGANIEVSFPHAKVSIYLS
ncbi:MAG: hypothetical protein O2854_02015 [Chloroflexi bacterium]|nr:hypothetical protein [Chloroflexota bacterium]